MNSIDTLINSPHFQQGFCDALDGKPITRVNDLGYPANEYYRNGWLDGDEQRVLTNECEQ